MNTERISMQQAQSQYISFLINQIGIKKLFPYFTNTDVITCLRQRNLHQFLLNIPSQQLRSAMQERQQRQDQQAAQRTIMKYNVLDFTLKELVKHCWDNRLIDYNHYQNQVYTMNNFYQLAMRLVNKIPAKYEVGKRSHHFNKSRQIQEMFGIKREDDQQDQFNQGQQQQYQQQDQDQVIFEQQNVENDNQQQFVNDDVQQSNYDIVSEEQESFQQQNQQDEQIQSVNKKTKKKLIKKSQKSKNTRKNMKINQPRKKLRKNVVNNQDQQQNIKNNQQIFESQQQYQDQKNQPKTQAKCNKNNNKKKNTIDSGDEN